MTWLEQLLVLRVIGTAEQAGSGKICITARTGLMKGWLLFFGIQLPLLYNKFVNSNGQWLFVGNDLLIAC